MGAILLLAAQGGFNAGQYLATVGTIVLIVSIIATVVIGTVRKRNSESWRDLAEQREAALKDCDARAAKLASDLHAAEIDLAKSTTELQILRGIPRADVNEVAEKMAARNAAEIAQRHNDMIATQTEILNALREQGQTLAELVHRLPLQGGSA